MSYIASLEIPYNYLQAFKVPCLQRSFKTQQPSHCHTLISLRHRSSLFNNGNEISYRFHNGQLLLNEQDWHHSSFILFSIAWRLHLINNNYFLSFLNANLQRFSESFQLVCRSLFTHLLVVGLFKTFSSLF